MKKLTKKAKTGAVVSVVWLIILFVTAINGSGGSLDEAFWSIFLLVGALPVLIGWGIRWIRQDGTESGGVK